MGIRSSGNIFLVQCDRLKKYEHFNAVKEIDQLKREIGQLVRSNN